MLYAVCMPCIRIVCCLTCVRVTCSLCCFVCLAICARLMRRLRLLRCAYYVCCVCGMPVVWFAGVAGCCVLVTIICVRVCYVVRVCWL